MFIDKSVNFGFHLRRFDKLWFFLKNLPWYTAYSKVSNIVMTMRRTSLNLAPLKTKTRNRQSSWSLSGITYFLCPVRLPTKVESVPDGGGGIPRRVDLFLPIWRHSWYCFLTLDCRYEVKSSMAFLCLTNPYWCSKRVAKPLQARALFKMICNLITLFKVISY